MKNRRRTAANSADVKGAIRKSKEQFTSRRIRHCNCKFRRLSFAQTFEMKIRTLICCALFALSAKAQTKEAEFKKLENLLNKSKGVEVDDYKVTGIVFTENTVKLEMSAKGKAGSFVYTNLRWDDFGYLIKPEEESKGVSRLLISFDEKIDVTVYESKKQVDKDTDDELMLLISTADAKQVEQQLEELRTYTVPSLVRLRTADQAELTRFITKNLNAALEGDNGKVTDISACGITVVYNNKEISMPTKNLQFHEKEFLGDVYLLCFGKGNAQTVKVKTGATLKNLTLEHPGVELDFEDDNESVKPVEYAIKRLASFCQ